MITVVVLTHNEEADIKRCLTGLLWADEILVIDSFSGDGTLAVIKKIGDSKIKILQKEGHGDMSELRNFALSKAQNEWVLFVDADEAVSDKLQKEIRDTLQKVPANTKGFYLSRRDIFLGKELRHGETGHIRLLRLARKTAGQWVRPVHETWQIAGETSELKQPLLHYSHQSIAQFITQINKWSTLDAPILAKEGKGFSLPAVFVKPLGKFIQNYFLRLGFLDGYPGFVMAFMMSFYSLVVRVKQYDLHTTPPAVGN